jgi:hypothetical protein
VNPDDRPRRTADVQRYLARQGIKGIQVVKGPGYFCFEGKATEDWLNHTVEVFALGDMTYDQWLRTFKAMNENPANRKSTRRSNC